MRLPNNAGAWDKFRATGCMGAIAGALQCVLSSKIAGHIALEMDLRALRDRLLEACSNLEEVTVSLARGPETALEEVRLAWIIANLSISTGP